MTDPVDPGDSHIPDTAGVPICGTTGGRTTVLEFPTCPRCQERVTPLGMRPEDAFNPGHPVGRILMGSAFGLPGYPEIPGVWKRFSGEGD